MRVTASYLEQVARKWQAAYVNANGKEAPHVVWERGWFKVGTVRYRRQHLEEMTRNLASVGQRRRRGTPMTTVRKSDGKVMDDLFIEIGQGPICPLCRWWGFDDWWLSNSCRSGSPPVRLHADLRCDDCEITFEITQYTDGETHSSYRRPALAPSNGDRGSAA